MLATYFCSLRNDVPLNILNKSDSSSNKTDISQRLGLFYWVFKTIWIQRLVFGFLDSIFCLINLARGTFYFLRVLVWQNSNFIPFFFLKMVQKHTNYQDFMCIKICLLSSVSSQILLQNFKSFLGNRPTGRLTAPSRSSAALNTSTACEKAFIFWLSQLHAKRFMLFFSGWHPDAICKISLLKREILKTNLLPQSDRLISEVLMKE